MRRMHTMRCARLYVSDRRRNLRGGASVAVLSLRRIRLCLRQHHVAHRLCRSRDRMSIHADVIRFPA